MKILITGGFGYLGSWLTEYYCKRNYDVHVLSKSNNRFLKNLSYKFIKADISDLKGLKSKIKGGFDYCLHAASVNNYSAENYAKKALLVNALGTRNIVEVLAQKGIKKFLYFSTFHVYNASKGSVNEALFPNPGNDYAATHLFAEYYIKQFYNSGKFPYVILRLTNCYGAPKQIGSAAWKLVINDLARMAFERGKIVLNSDGNSGRDFVWLGDVCQITKKLLTAKNILNGVFNVSSGSTHKIIDIANIVKRSYKDRYGKNIDITLNRENRDPISRNIVISNKELCSAINIKTHDKLYHEINEIFTLLESRC